MVDRAFKNDYPDFIVPSKIYLAHQVAVSLIFYFTVYYSLFTFCKKYLFKKQILKFFLATLSCLVIVVFALAWYQNYLLQHFPTVENVVLIPIHLFDTNAPNYLIQWIDVSLKISIFYMFLMVAFLARNYFIEIKTKEVLKQKQMEMELTLLKSQINPHFLFNALNSVYSLSLKKSDKTPIVVTQLSNILRYMLYESQVNKMLLAKEIQLVLDYLEIEKIKNFDNEDINVELHGNFLENKIVPLILLPLVENAVKHGIDSRVNNSFIHVYISCVENKFIFSCKNSFKPKTQQKLSSDFGGIGIENVKKRLELTYPNQYQLAISASENVFSVKLDINLEIA